MTWPACADCLGVLANGKTLYLPFLISTLLCSRKSERIKKRTAAAAAAAAGRDAPHSSLSLSSLPSELVRRVS